MADISFQQTSKHTFLRAFTHAFIPQNRTREYKKYEYTENTMLPPLRIVQLEGKRKKYILYFLF